jgi:ABC-2 type transport system permease protein
MAKPVLAQAGSEVKMTLKQGEAALLTIVIPVLGLVIFGNLKLLPLPPHVTSRVGFILSGAVAFGIMASGMVSQSITVAFDRSYGVLKRLGATPLGRSGVIFGKLAAVATLEIIQLVILVVVASLMGWSYSGDPVYLVIGWVLATSAFTGIGMLIGGNLKAELVLGLSTLLWLVLLGLGSMVVPLTSLPSFLRTIAELLPAASTSYFMVHGLTQGGSVPAWAWINLILWALIAPLAAAKTFKWS